MLCIINHPFLSILRQKIFDSNVNEKDENKNA